jgi:hypothetical protein
MWRANIERQASADKNGELNGSTKEGVKRASCAAKTLKLIPISYRQRNFIFGKED